MARIDIWGMLLGGKKMDGKMGSTVLLLRNISFL